MAARALELDPTRLIDATSGWFDNGVGDFSVRGSSLLPSSQVLITSQDNHHYANPQCGTPFYSINSRPYDPERIALQGEFGGIGHNLTIEQ